MTRRLLGKALRRLREDPVAVLRLAVAAARGLVTVVYYRIFARRVSIKLPFYVYGGWVRITGPGSVRIDRGCLVEVSVFDSMSIVTLSSEARVEIGPRCRLAGVTIRCAHSVVIEGQVMTGHCLIQDQEMVSAGLHLAARPEQRRPIRIGAGAWITRQVVIGPGADIGNESVVGVGSLCFRVTVPPGTVTVGSPVMRSVPISSLLAMNVSNGAQ